MTVTIDPASCHGFWPGHSVHWIHARHAWSSEARPVSNVIVHNNWVHFTCDGVTYSRWNHDADAIPELMAEFPDGSIVFYKEWRILSVDADADGGRRRFFNLDTEPSSCVVSERESR